MVVDPSAAGSLVKRLLQPAMASAIQQGQSFWSDYPGTKPFADKLTIIDDPLLPKGLASRLYDSEGIAAKPMTLVERGEVKQLYVDTYYGRKLKLAPTTGSSSNVIIQPGERSLQELIGAAGKGIYVTSWLGGNSDGTTGEFSLGLRGHLIVNGKIGAPVDEMNVTGDLETLFAGLVEVGNDPWRYSTLRTPTLVFENVDFSGA
jgi:PmbA protein